MEQNISFYDAKEGNPSPEIIDLGVIDTIRPEEARYEEMITTGLISSVNGNYFELLCSKAFEKSGGKPCSFTVEVNGRPQQFTVYPGYTLKTIIAKGFFYYTFARLWNEINSILKENKKGDNDEFLKLLTDYQYSANCLNRESDADEYFGMLKSIKGSDRTEIIEVLNDLLEVRSQLLSVINDRIEEEKDRDESRSEIYLAVKDIILGSNGYFKRVHDELMRNEGCTGATKVELLSTLEPNS